MLLPEDMRQDDRAWAALLWVAVVGETVKNAAEKYLKAPIIIPR